MINVENAKCIHTLFTGICMGHSCCINNDLVYVFGGDFETVYNFVEWLFVFHFLIVLITY